MMIPDSGNDRMIDVVFFQMRKPNLKAVQSQLSALSKNKESLYNSMMSAERVQKLNGVLNIKIKCKFFTVSDLQWQQYLPPGTKDDSEEFQILQL